MKKVNKVKNNNIKPITPFKTLEEEANFRDTHSILDYEEELKLLKEKLKTA